MASLTRGISFRRQGSSGSTWTYNEEGILVRLPKPEGQASHGGGSLARIHNWQGAEKSLPKQGSHPAGSSMLERSKSVGCAPTRLSPAPAADPPQKPNNKSRVLKWFKKTLGKLKGGSETRETES